MNFTFLNTVLLLITFSSQIISNCARPKNEKNHGVKGRKRRWPKGHRQQRRSRLNIFGKSSSSSPYDEDISKQTNVDGEFLESEDTQRNDHYGVLQTDILANVQLLGPTVDGGCTDDNASAEAMSRHTTNVFFPKYVIQEKHVRDRVTESQLKKMVAALPPHPPAKFRPKAPEYSVENERKRRAKWENIHVHFHPVGPVFIVRSLDVSRSKDDPGQDTVDSLESPSRSSDEGSSDKENVNSEIPMSDNGGKIVEVKKKTGLKKTIFVMTPSTQQSSVMSEKKDAKVKDKEAETHEKPTQEDTQPVVKSIPTKEIQLRTAPSVAKSCKKTTVDLRTAKSEE